MLAKNFSEGEPLTVILGDNIFQDSLALHVKNYQGGAHLLIKEVPDPQRFGVAEIINDTIASIQEKPSNPKAIMQLQEYIYLIKTCLELSVNVNLQHVVNLKFQTLMRPILKNNNVTYGILNGWWSDAGTFTSLTKASELVLTQPMH